MRFRTPAILAIAIGAAATPLACDRKAPEEPKPAASAAPQPTPAPATFAEQMQADYPPFPISWVQDTPPRGTILILPPTDSAGTVLPELEPLSNAATYQLTLLLPPDIGVVSFARVRAAVEDFFPRNDSGRAVFSPERIAEVATAYGATHTITLKAGDGSITAAMSTPQGEKTTTIPASVEKNLAFAQALNAWALGQSGIALSGEESARFSKPLFAGAVDRWPLPEQGDALAAKIQQLLTTPGPSDPATLVEASVFFRTRPGSFDEATARTLITAPGGPNLPAYEYIARANVWFALRDSEAAIRETRAGFAVHKRNWHLLDAVTNQCAQTGVDDYSLNFVRSAAGRAGMLNATAAVQLEAMLWNAQRDLPNSIPLPTSDAQPTEPDANAEYAAVQAEQLLPSFNLRPVAIAPVLYANAVGGRPEQVEPLFRTAIAAYPGALSVWRARIEVETPLYRGDAAKLASLLAEVEAATAKDPLLGCLPYHAAAASAKAEFAGARDAISRWRQAHPAEWTKVRTGLDRYASVGPLYESRAKAWLAAAGD